VSAKGTATVAVAVAQLVTVTLNVRRKTKRASQPINELLLLRSGQA